MLKSSQINRNNAFGSLHLSEKEGEWERADARMRCTLTIFNRIYLFFRMQWHSYMFAIWNICWFFVVLWPWCLSNSQKQILYGSRNAFRVCKCECFCVSLALSLSLCMYRCLNVRMCENCAWYLLVSRLRVHPSAVNGVYFGPKLQEPTFEKKFEWHFERFEWRAI